MNIENPSSTDVAETLGTRIRQRTATAGVIGLGYVGLPLAVAIAKAGFLTIGFDIDPAKSEKIRQGRSYVDAVTSDTLSSLVGRGSFAATSDFETLERCDVIAICVPTPLTRQREPELSFVIASARTIAQHLKPGRLIVLESTTYPGTTRETMKPVLEESGLKAGRDFFIGFSPEREDPGNRDFETSSIPKIVAGDGPKASALVSAFYGAVFDQVVPVSSPDVAEAVKITENVFRSVNIALVNELKVIYDAMGIEIWEVIDAAKTKPFGYMPFYPGPGLGGHCIPIDPFYLSWRAREFELPTRFIELAGEINTAMPHYVVHKLEEALDKYRGLALGSAKILLLGLAYKKNVGDVRESPSFRIMELLERRGTRVAFHDPYVSVVPETREHAKFSGRASVTLTPENVAAFDAVLVATDHDAVDYAMLAESAGVIVDTRNVFARKGFIKSSIVKA
jgi:UDP-N-acetyl-D-glucosamine dehydrogenase